MATEYRPAPNAEVGGRNIDPEEDRNIRCETDCTGVDSKWLHTEVFANNCQFLCTTATKFLFSYICWSNKTFFDERLRTLSTFFANN